MSKFILEYKDKYTMSLLDDYVSTSTDSCDSMDEAVGEMMELFKKRCRDRSLNMVESMTKIKEAIDDNSFQIDFIGINLINSDNTKKKIANQAKKIVDEYCEFMA